MGEDLADKACLCCRGVVNKPSAQRANKVATACQRLQCKPITRASYTILMMDGGCKR